jgi:hypothetical protein
MSSNLVANELFTQLVNTYPTYQELKAYLTTCGIKENTKPDDPLVLLRYNRESCDMTNPVTRAFRSVVWDTLKNRPVFVAPQKSQPNNTFPADFSKVIVEDFVDGVMVNLFMDPYKNTWRLATRSRLDADNKFYRHTFAELFTSAWGQGDFNALSPGFGYSFVVQHPANRIVVPVQQALATLVEVSNIGPTGTLYVTPQVGQNLVSPRRFAVSSLAECQLLMSNIEQFEGLKAQGIVLRDITNGQRWKMRTTAYTVCRRLRGNHSQLEYVWFDNLKNNTLDKYLAVYPEEGTHIMETMTNWNRIMSELYNWYVHVFKIRDTPKNQIPVQYKGILFDLHGYYIGTLAKMKKTLGWKEHQEFMMNQDLKRMVFLTTYKVGSAPPPSFQKRQKILQEKQQQKQEQEQQQHQTSMVAE